MQTEPARVPGETRDWTFVLESGCRECGWESVPDVGRLREAWDRAVGAWSGLLARPDVAERPSPTVWSPLEYGAHSRDMIRLLGLRVASMVAQRDPGFANWDGDLANVVRRDWAGDPLDLSADIELAGAQTAAVLDALTPADLDRPGHRGDGVGFSVLGLWQYVEHDVSHHVFDVRRMRIG